MAVARAEKVPDLMRFFKTGKGEYAEGDCFVGIAVPDNRRVSKRWHTLGLDELQEMLRHEVHEFRLAALLALVEKYRKCGDADAREEIVRFYLSNTRYADNWDLVDLSAPYIMGEEVAAGRHCNTVRSLAQSDLLWDNRIAIVSMLKPVMRYRQLGLPIEMSRSLIGHPHDLMRKAVGWVLREIGKKDVDRLRTFLADNISRISAISLSYATEKLSPDERLHWRTLRRNARH